MSADVDAAREPDAIETAWAEVKRAVVAYGDARGAEAEAAVRAERLDVEGVIAELVSVEAVLDNARLDVTRILRTLQGIARLAKDAERPPKRLVGDVADRGK